MAHPALRALGESRQPGRRATGEQQPNCRRLRLLTPPGPETDLSALCQPPNHNTNSLPNAASRAHPLRRWATLALLFIVLFKSRAVSRLPVTPQELPPGEAGWALPRGSVPGARTEVPQYRGRPWGQRPDPERRHPAPARRCLPVAPVAPSMLWVTCMVLLLGRAAPAAGKGPPVCAVIAAGERQTGSGARGARAAAAAGRGAQTSGVGCFTCGWWVFPAWAC